MELIATSGAISSQKGVNPKHQEAVERVQTEFLNQICKGKSESEAFKESLKAIDEKYNPQEDSFELNAKDGEIFGEACMLKSSFKLPTGEQILKWLNIISVVLPKIIEIFEMIPNSENGDNNQTQAYAVA